MKRKQKQICVQMILLAVIIGSSICNVTGCQKEQGEFVMADEITDSYLTQDAQRMEEDSELSSREESSSSREQDTQSPQKLMVYVCGAVEVPGVYELPEGARICDAVEAAGGMCDEASNSYWNLAQTISDGDMIYVPTEEEAGTWQNRNEQEAGISADSGADGGIGTDGKINLNTASREQLMTIPGIGEAKADKIIAYRQSGEEFQQIEDIMKISGIKEGLFEQIKDYITVS